MTQPETPDDSGSDYGYDYGYDMAHDVPRGMRAPHPRREPEPGSAASRRLPSG